MRRTKEKALKGMEEAKDFAESHKEAIKEAVIGGKEAYQKAVKRGPPRPPPNCQRRLRPRSGRCSPVRSSHHEGEVQMCRHLEARPVYTGGRHDQETDRAVEDFCADIPGALELVRKLLSLADGPWRECDHSGRIASKASSESALIAS